MGDVYSNRVESEDNCRAATSQENNSNRVDNIYVKVGGREFTITSAARFFGMASRDIIHKRKTLGWEDERAALEPTNQTNCVIAKKYYGLHLMIDLFDCVYSDLASIDTVARFLREAPGDVGMVTISPPHVFKYLGSEQNSEWGITGTTILSTSHVSAHTYPEQRYVSVDLFSCRGFNPYEVLLKVRQIFGGQSAAIHIVKRGEGFPRQCQ